MSENTKPRWKAICLYRSAAGPVDVEHHFDEVEDLHDLIERGPHWDTLIKCTVTLNRPIEVGLTLEAAAEL